MLLASDSVFPILRIGKTRLVLKKSAFSSREPVSTSLENALAQVPEWKKS